jgi:hypothetical protein
MKQNNKTLIKRVLLNKKLLSCFALALVLVIKLCAIT